MVLKGILCAHTVQKLTVPEEYSLNTSKAASRTHTEFHCIVTSAHRVLPRHITWRKGSWSIREMPMGGSSGLVEMFIVGTIVSNIFSM